MIIKAVLYDDLIIDQKKKDKNEDKCDYTSEQPCAICGKSIKNNANFKQIKQIRLICGGEYFTENTNDKLPDDMGWFKVGISCYNKFKKLVKDIEI